MLRRKRRRRRSEPFVVVDDTAAQTSALDTLAELIDPAKLSDEQFVEAARVLHTLDHAGAGVSVRALSTQALVDVVAKASNSQLEAVCADPVLRPFLLDEIFRRMADHLVPEKVRDLMFTVTWRFPTPAGDDHDRFQTVFSEGTCLTGPDMGRDADTTVTIPLAGFVRVATGTTAIATLLVRGKVKIKGDYAIAATLTTYFDMPKPTV